jgi:hypothetical protein
VLASREFLYSVQVLPDTSTDGLRQRTDNRVDQVAGAYRPEHADEPFGDVMRSITKYVVSNSLQAAEWQNSCPEPFEGRE